MVHDTSCVSISILHSSYKLDDFFKSLSGKLGHFLTCIGVNFGIIVDPD